MKFVCILISDSIRERGTPVGTSYGCPFSKCGISKHISYDL